MEKLEKLFEPIKIGPYVLKNRIVFAPMRNQLNLTSGEVSERTVSHYATRAKGGAAMIILEDTAVDVRHTMRPLQLGIWDDKFIPGLHRLAEAIHINGALACVQLHHPGMWGTNPVSPSGAPCWRHARGWVSPRVLALEEVEEIPRLFGEAAFRAKTAGFDMVELHGGISYLIQQFVSPHTNLRVEKYGGSLEKRWTLPLEIIDEVQKRCGRDLPIGYRIVADELLPDGVLFEPHTIPFAKRLEQVGVAYLSVQLGTYETTLMGEGLQAMRSPKGTTNKYTAELKKHVAIPVFAGQQIHEPAFMQKILEKGIGDVILLGRPLLCDPDLPNKASKGRIDDIRLCNRCTHCSGTGLPLTCALNIEVGGREREYAIQPTTSSKKVLVIGGGPAGLEAARVAAIRGHNVILLEKEAELGGNIRFATLPIGKEDLLPFTIGWLQRQCRKAGVNIELNKEATPKLGEEIEPDVVIVATGSTPLIPPIPGVEKKNVVTAVDVLTGKASVGKRVVVVGGGQVGAETADFIAEKSLAESVTIVEMLPAIATDMESTNRAYMIPKLSQYGVKVLTNTKVEEITDTGVVVIDKEWKRQTIEADSIVLAMGYASNKALAEELRGKSSELYMIGDCVQPRRILNAIHEGSYIGRTI